MSTLLTNKFFLLTLAFLGPFIAIWIMASFLHAFIAYVVFAAMLFFFVVQLRQNGHGAVRVFISICQVSTAPLRKLGLDLNLEGDPRQ